jgi:hypothetical protein
MLTAGTAAGAANLLPAAAAAGLLLLLLHLLSLPDRFRERGQPMLLLQEQQCCAVHAKLALGQQREGPSSTAAADAAAGKEAH